MSAFLSTLLDRHPEWRHLLIIERSGPGWQGRALIVPPPFDHSHIHRNWPPERPGDLWSDALTLVEAVLNEKVAALSGWIDDELRVGALHESDSEPNLMVPGIQLIRIRTWLGTFDRDIRQLGEER